MNKYLLDDKFIEILEEKIDSLDFNNESVAFVINTKSLIEIGKYIDNLKPKPKYRNYKNQILEFLEKLEDNHDLTKEDVVILVQTYLSDLFLFLKSEHSFMDRHGWFWSSVFNLVLDIILIFIGITKYYYYIPIFTIIAVVKNILMRRKAKKEGKYIDF